jgi:hypothetical protein
MAEDPELLRAIDRLTAIVENHLQVDGFLDVLKEKGAAAAKAVKDAANKARRAANITLYKNASSQVPAKIREFADNNQKTWNAWKTERDTANVAMDAAKRANNSSEQAAQKKIRDDAQTAMNGIIDKYFDEHKEEYASHLEAFVEHYAKNHPLEFAAHVYDG